MKRSVVFIIVVVVLSSTGRAVSQCELKLPGTWETGAGAYDQPLQYRFSTDGKLTIVPATSSSSAKPMSLKYELDEPGSPKVITVTSPAKTPLFASGKTAMKIVAYDDVSITCEIPGLGATRWTRVDPHRYFLILAARNGDFYDTSGPAFPILIKAVGETQIDAVGMFPDRGSATFGRVPAEIYKAFLQEPENESEVMLRLELNAAQYERAHEVLQTWARRAREDALLYPYALPLNNVLLVKAVTETLNRCQESFTLYKLNYIHPEDWISDRYSPQFIPFFYFKELRRLNESRHVEDHSFQQSLSVSTKTSQ